MLFADIGYAILREDVVQESSWNDYSNYYKSVGRDEKLVGENLLAWPEKNQYEFGDSVIVGTIQQSDFRITRVVYLGDFHQLTSHPCQHFCNNWSNRSS